MGQRKLLANNKKARHDYFIEEVYEAGLVLTGTEIKSLRQGRVNLKESYAKIEKGEVFIYNMHISPSNRETATMWTRCGSVNCFFTNRRSVS